MSSYIPSKIELKPKRYHGYAVLLFILGTLFPPLAVAARFGIGKDFWLNLLLTICGYIPGKFPFSYTSSDISTILASFMLFYSPFHQNIRNNKNHARTPKWAQRYGLVDTSEIKRKERKSQWASRYNDRLPRSTLEGQPYEEGQEHGSSVDISLESGSNGRPRRQANGELWRPEDEQYYNAPDKSSVNSSSGRWHYPANFDDVEPVSTGKKTKKKKKKDRWERTQDAYSMSAEGEQRKKKKKRRSSDADSSIATTEFPEDPEGGLYGEPGARSTTPPEAKKDKTTDSEIFNHEF
ncbi:hypothetical protein D9613_003059 [Agrocybe pediades]|uniref:Uncharacterized protein n=1 Tax=Agrocybe pediades TaxID=84607 RepID=A0A8H4QS25_9AGAR|nr:hypothetical protein D9613_003059 [Agrocybe pediades]